MHRLLVTFLLAFVGCSILAAIMSGGGGIVSTTLADDISADAMYAPAVSTSLFGNADIITIGDERLLYSSKNATGFILQTRGYSDTTAANHTAGRRIYTSEAGVLNEALGFNLAVQLETGGTWGVVMLPITFFTRTLPHLVVLNVGFLQTPELSIIAILWMVAGIALIVVLAIQIAPIAVALVTGFLGWVRR